MRATAGYLAAPRMLKYRSLSTTTLYFVCLHRAVVSQRCGGQKVAGSNPAGAQLEETTAKRCSTGELNQAPS